ncbi:uncharacterized protein LOC135385277 [Ornithodoros turicata]|uniref:uncharacterized protein LOC135385277 n=1 Tax=Ornithodoros turicata TaxID=34597 RepID=UPI0031391978
MTTSAQLTLTASAWSDNKPSVVSKPSQAAVVLLPPRGLPHLVTRVEHTQPLPESMASPSGNHSSSADDPPISTTTTLRLPPFWRQNPWSWFRQVEAQFQLRHIQSQQSKYFHVLAGLPPEVAAELDDVLAAVQLDQAYDVLKTAILDRMEVSARAKLQQLLSDEDLGDRKPSQMLHRMKQLLGDSATEEQQPILRELFFQRLPQAMRVVLAGSEDLSLDRLATLADRIADYSEPPKPSIMAAATSEQSPRLDRIELQLQQLTDALQSLTAAGPRRRSRSAPRSRRRSSPTPSQEPQVANRLC